MTGMVIDLLIVFAALSLLFWSTFVFAYFRLNEGSQQAPRSQQLPEWAVRENERTAHQLREMQQQLSTRPQQPRQITGGQ